MIYIYLRTNTVNGKQYVGQTSNYRKRNNHWNSLKMPYANELLTTDRGKYGLDKWESKVLAECDDSEGDYWEQYYIKELDTKYPNGYNMSDGGKGTPNIFVSEETRKKLSDSLKGRSSWLKGKHHSEEARKKMSEAHKGKHNSVNTEIKKGEHRSPKTEFKKGDISLRRKIVYQYTIDGEFVKKWDSATEAAKSGFLRNCVTQCCLGTKKTHKGFIWSYTKKEDIN